MASSGHVRETSTDRQASGRLNRLWRVFSLSRGDRGAGARRPNLRSTRRRSSERCARTGLRSTHPRVQGSFSKSLIASSTSNFSDPDYAGNVAALRPMANNETNAVPLGGLCLRELGEHSLPASRLLPKHCRESCCVCSLQFTLSSDVWPFRLSEQYDSHRLILIEQSVLLYVGPLYAAGIGELHLRSAGNIR